MINLKNIAAGDLSSLAPIETDLFDDEEYIRAAQDALEGDDSDLRYILVRAWTHDEFSDWQRAASTPREEQRRSDEDFEIWLAGEGRAALARAIQRYTGV